MNIFRSLTKLSERRGKEASGFALLKDNRITVYKSPLPASEMLRKPAYKDNFGNSILQDGIGLKEVTAIGHSRLVTDGTEKLNRNNQPVIKSSIVGIHNGIIVNHHTLWKTYPDEPRLTQLDSEIILTLIRRFYNGKKILKQALKRTFKEIYGMANVALLFKDLNNLLLVTNNGSLYYMAANDGNSLVFASEYFLLETLVSRKKIKKHFSLARITQLAPRSACLIDLENTRFDKISLDQYREDQIDGLEFRTIHTGLPEFAIDDISEEDKEPATPTQLAEPSIHWVVPQDFITYFDTILRKIQSLRRCTKCLLPETFPFIEFDPDGVCNYCHNYKKISCLGSKKLRQRVEPFRKTNGRPDCVIGFSGGRDSSYTLHYVKKVLNMNPIAYSYDWGMLTDLGRRNQARLCDKLGVEHILISADIRRKRKYIRKNVLAWLKRPSLGTIPLFMAGDKQYFYYANKLMDQYNIKLVLFGENLLETTFFKYGFCGINPNFNKKKSFSMNIGAKLKMVLFYGKEYLLNPAYLNSSLLDTIGAFLSFYFIQHNYINIYNYLKWDENIILSPLLNEYSWEVSPDTKSTWRIGDGTASFYNYIYFTVAGFSEIDTFRSNQIREGMIDRKAALKLVYEENIPRFQSIKWYCDTIDIDFEQTVRRINQIPKLYDM